MQCDDLEVKMPVVPLNELDQDVLHEIQKHQLLNMISLNTRYVSNVSIGFRVRPIAPHVRYKPYNMPKREERHRTRSENNDNDNVGIVKAVLDETVNVSLEEVTQMKKAKSLESIVLEGVKEGGFKLPEVEIVSDRIEKLKVDE